MPERTPRHSHIPFIEARFFDPAETRYTLEERFRRYLLGLRAGRLRSRRALAEELADADGMTTICRRSRLIPS